MTGLDIITLADLQNYAPAAGTERDKACARYITVVSRLLEKELGRRIRYRGPATVAELGNIIASRQLQNESINAGGTITQPNAAGVTLIVAATATQLGVAGKTTTQAGTVTVTGTFNGVVGDTEVFDLSWGLVQHGLKFCTAITNVTTAGLSGHDATDTYRIGSSRGYTEYHTPGCEAWVLLPYEWPVASVLELNEDASRAYGASSKLTTGTDYELVIEDTNRMQRSSLIRMASQLPFPFLGGWRAEKLVHAAGYAAAYIPEEIRDVCKRLVALMQDEIDNERLGMVSMTDPSGNFTRFAAASLTSEMRRQISPYRRRTYNSETGERTFALEDAA